MTRGRIGRWSGCAVLGLTLAAVAIEPAASADFVGKVPGAGRPFGKLAERINVTFSEYRGTDSLDDGQRLGPWQVVFDGVSFGPGVRFSAAGLRLKPDVARTPDQTSSAMVVSRMRFGQGALHVTASWTTGAPTRRGTPNPWEVGWLVWDYVDNDHFTYLILKPTGWEVGRRSPTEVGGQRFIADGADPATPRGQVRTVSIDRLRDQTTIRVDGAVLIAYSLPASERHGAVGMYSEDSTVDWIRIFVATRRR